MASLEDPLVSVVIPAYNAAATVEATIRSALSQSLSSIEVIVVDDGSTDATAELVARLAKTDQRLRMVQSENRGVAHARNLGIEHARGTFIAPLDADDVWHPSKLEKQIAAFQRDPELGFVYCFNDRINSSDEIVWRMHWLPVNGWAFLQHAMINFVGNGSNFLVPRRIAVAIGGYSSALRKIGAEGCEDWLLQLRIARNFRVGCVAEYLVGYRTHSLNMSTNRFAMALSESVALRLALQDLNEDLRFAHNAALLAPDVILVHTALRHRQWRIGLTAAKAIASREGYRATIARLLREQAVRLPHSIRRNLIRLIPRVIKRRLAPLVRRKNQTPLRPEPISEEMLSLLAQVAEHDRRLVGATHRVRPVSDRVADDTLLELVTSISGRSLKGWDEDIICGRVRTHQT